MEIIKVFNNNAVLAIDNEKEEVVVMGKGIGFGKRSGDEFDDNLIEKVFKENAVDDTFQELFVELSSGEVTSILEIVKHAEQVLDQDFMSNIYVTLADHIHFAIERYKQDLPLTNPLAWDVKRLFNEEFQVGKDALDIVEKNVGIRLPTNEAASIALHLINARKKEGRMNKTVAAVRIVSSILDIVQYHFGHEFDEDTLAYSRFVTHLQFFSHRVLNGEVSNDGEAFLYDQVSRSYPDAMACAKKIGVFIENSYAYKVSKEELVYLTIHIQKIIQKNI
ncbi:PRD domain-containing protein [Aerococcus agrisoli]|uniref:PRD domain-containing protein n=1 Tax=Aerococcus agrisoli TaxID=2487350 RepID=A0A3N4GGK4_9LACT|nr:PRD domain-containing protein [Aerococcus agrisoli]RPA58221.1 PRD domain-containing protein [Aerococcus agrisoli]